MKLFIQLPCLNEADTLPITLAELPRRVEGFDEVKWLVINDGSTDATEEVAYEHGVDYVVSHTRTMGLGRAFATGVEECLKLGADVIVNTDADNQYNAGDIAKLVQPILNQQAAITIGARPIQTTPHFSGRKKLFQRLGSWVVRVASHSDVADATSGFRAMSRQAALRLNVFSDYTYTLETIIQAGSKNMSIVSVPIRTNEDLRPSRLFSSIPQYIFRSVLIIVRIIVVYRPLVCFAVVGSVLMAIGTVLSLRYVYFIVMGQSGGHVQSLILASLLIGMGFQTIFIGFVADLLSVNRQLIEDLKVSLFEIRHGAGTSEKQADTE
jgi:glycosyltransferase involved in cell wall biosynthesis